MAADKKQLREILKEEYKKCIIDPGYFIRKYCKIQHPIDGNIPFKMYPYQEDVLQEFIDKRFNIVLKSRQTGISTLTSAYALWLMLFNNDKNVLVIATNQEVAKNLVTKVRHMHSNLPVFLRGKPTEDNKLSLRFDNGSQIKASTSSGDAGRSEALSLLIFDEAAFIERIEDIWTASAPTLSTGGSAIAVSTPNGVGNWFHQTWQQAEAQETVQAGQNQILWNPIFLHWTVHPDRDQDWRDEQTRLMGEKKASQECDGDFITSGHTVIPGEIIQWYKENIVKDPIQYRGIDRNIWIWEPVDYQKNYMVVADVGRGDGTDSSTFHVLELETATQVAEYRGKVDTTLFGKMLIAISVEYNNALLVIENKSIGWATIQVVIDHGYKNLFYMSQDMQYVDVEHQLSNKYHSQDNKMIPGFTTSSKSRPMIISKLDDYFREKTVVVRSIRTIDELFVFNWIHGKAQALRGYNDDLIMPLAIGLWVRDTALKLRQLGMDLTKHAIDSISVQRPYDGVYSTKPLDQDNPYKMLIGNNETEDLGWLLG